MMVTINTLVLRICSRTRTASTVCAACLFFHRGRLASRGVRVRPELAKLVREAAAQSNNCHKVIATSGLRRRKATCADVLVGQPCWPVDGRLACLSPRATPEQVIADPSRQCRKRHAGGARPAPCACATPTAHARRERAPQSPAPDPVCGIEPRTHMACLQEFLGRNSVGSM